MCVNIQLCAGLEDDIEGSMHAVVQRRLERSLWRSREEESGISEEEDGKIEKAREERLKVETEGTEE